MYKVIAASEQILTSCKNPFSIPVRSLRNGNFDHDKKYDIHGVPYLLSQFIERWTVDIKTTEKENYQFQKNLQFFKCVYNFI